MSAQKEKTDSHRRMLGGEWLGDHLSPISGKPEAGSQKRFGLVFWVVGSQNPVVANAAVVTGLKNCRQ